MDEKNTKRKPDDILAEIEAKLATVDGIATADAFKLGGLVREYGEAKAGEASSAVMMPLLDMMLKPPKAKPGELGVKEPWER